MSDVIIFHHVQGLTSGILSIAEEFRCAGHDVVIPDLFEGQTFDSLAHGVAFATELGRETMLERASAAAEDLPAELVYVRFSMGARPAQMLTQTRTGAKGAILFHGYHPIGEFPAAWPNRIPLQVHRMESDEWCDAATADKLAHEVPNSELFTYPGSAHLFTDASLAEYEPHLARLAIGRAIDLLERIDKAMAPG